MITETEYRARIRNLTDIQTQRMNDPAATEMDRIAIYQEIQDLQKEWRAQ